MSENKKEPTDINQKLLQRLCFGVSIVFGTTIILSWVLLPEPYTFFKDYISYLGGVLSKHEGNNNLASRITFSAGLFIVALLLILISIQYLKSKSKDKRDISKAIFLIIGAIGAIMTGFPHDGNNSLIHFMGAFGFVVSLNIFLFECYFLATKKDRSLGSILEKIVTIMLIVITAFYTFLYIYFSFINTVEDATFLFDFLTEAILPFLQKIMVFYILLGYFLIDPADLKEN
jgi:hypothetical protein